MFKIFIKSKVSNLKKKINNLRGKNIINLSLYDLYSIHLFLKKHIFFEKKNFSNTKLVNLYVYKFIIDSFFRKNNKIVFFISLFFLVKTKKLLFLYKLYENNLYCFSKVFKNKIFSVFWCRKYSNEFFYGFWRVWRYRHRSRVKEDIRVSFLDYSKKVYKHKLNTYYWLNFSKIKPKILSASARYYSVKFKSFYKNITILKNKPLLVLPKYASSSLHKNIDINTLRYEYQFLRKNKVYNKGRYSRTRQNYRTGVYMCIYLSLVTIFGLYFIFYRFTFTFTHVWWLFVYFIFSFFAPKIIQNRLYELNTLYQKLINFCSWVLSLINSIK